MHMLIHLLCTIATDFKIEVEPINVLHSETPNVKCFRLRDEVFLDVYCLFSF